MARLPGKNEYQVYGDITVCLVKRKDYNKPFSFIIDTHNLHKLNSIEGRWCLQWKKSSNRYIVIGFKKKDGKYSPIPLHSQIIEAPKGHFYQFKNGNSLDLRENNIIVSQDKTKNEDKPKYVSFNKRKNKWHAQFKYQGKMMYFGCYKTEFEAIQASKNARKELGLE